MLQYGTYILIEYGAPPPILLWGLPLTVVAGIIFYFTKYLATVFWVYIHETIKLLATFPGKMKMICSSNPSAALTWKLHLFGFNNILFQTVNAEARCWFN